MPRDRGHKHSSGFSDDSSGLSSKQMELIANGQVRQDPVSSCVFGVIFLLIGVGIILLAVGVIPSPETSFKAPHWVVGCVGALFGGAGLLTLLQGLGMSPNSPIIKILGPIVMLCLGTPFVWIIFGDSHAPLEMRIVLGLFCSMFAGIFVLAFALSKNPRLLLKIAKNNPEVREKIETLERINRNR